MTSAEQIMRGLYAALDAGDMDTFINAISDDVVLRSHQAGPLSGEVIGKSAVLEWMQTAMGAMDEKQTIEKYVASGDSVVVLGEETVTSRATGKSYTGAFAHHWVVRDGQIVLFEDFATTGTDIWE